MKIVFEGKRRVEPGFYADELMECPSCGCVIRLAATDEVLLKDGMPSYQCPMVFCRDRMRLGYRGKTKC